MGEWTRERHEQAWGELANGVSLSVVGQRMTLAEIERGWTEIERLRSDLDATIAAGLERDQALASVSADRDRALRSVRDVRSMVDMAIRERSEQGMTVAPSELAGCPMGALKTLQWALGGGSLRAERWASLARLRQLADDMSNRADEIAAALREAADEVGSLRAEADDLRRQLSATRDRVEQTAREAFAAEQERDRLRAPPAPLTEAEARGVAATVHDALLDGAAAEVRDADARARAAYAVDVEANDGDGCWTRLTERARDIWRGVVQAVDATRGEQVAPLTEEEALAMAQDYTTTNGGKASEVAALLLRASRGEIPPEVRAPAPTVLCRECSTPAAPVAAGARTERG